MKAQGFNDNWLFSLDGERKPVTLPHDAMIHQDRWPDAPGGSGHAYFPGGVYTYEKTFYCPADWAEKTVLLDFGGVYRNAAVSLNGQELCRHSYGYTGFTVDLTGRLLCGRDNQITVTADNSQLPNSRWYSGGGIYRPVALVTGGKAHIEWQGLKVDTLSYAPARVRVEVPATAGKVRVEILDGGAVVASGEGNSLELEIPNAKLWSAEHPHLYTCRATLLEDGQAVDAAQADFGVRQVEWSTQGLFVNGESVLLRGGCIHHDNGIVGAAAFEKSEERRVRLLKEAGFNAIRSAHNPASEALLAACDRYGMYVMDEGWDMWYGHKTRYDYADDFLDNYQDDLRAMVKKDYNHPSVILYSIGNEVSEPATEQGQDLAREMVARLHELDGSRPVTAGINLMILTNSANGKPLYKEEGGRADESANQKGGMNSAMFNLMASMMGTGMNRAANSSKADQATTPVLDALDIAGYNYASGRYRMEGEKHPDRVIVGSETFPQDIYKNWQMVKELPYLIGDFMWVAWDYIGETGIGTWAYTADAKTFDKPYPWLLADCGALDILGDPNAELFLAQAAWGLLNKPAIAVRPVNHKNDKLIKSVWRGTNGIPSWSWHGCEGNPAVVEVYACADSVKLLLDGKSLGRKRIKDGVAIFKTKYAPGELTAVAYNQNGQEVGRESLYSSVGRVKLSLRPEETSIRVGEVAYVPVTLTGANGMRECACDRRLTATVEGGELVGFGSADPRTEERFDAGECVTYYGRAMAVVRGTKAGSMVLTVRDGKEENSVVIEVI